MIGPVRYAVSVALVLMLISAIAPLVLFTYTSLKNPGCINLEVNPVEQVNVDRYRVIITVNYCSSVPLRDFKVEIGSTEMLFEEVKAGRVSGEIVLSSSDLQAGVRRVEFKVAGLYRVVIELGW